MTLEELAQRSPACTALLAMIEKDWLLLGPSDLDEYLAGLQKQGFITGAEHRALFILAMNKKKSNSLAAK